MLLVIDYIKEHGIEKLKEELGVETRLYDDRIVLNYSQIESPKFNPIIKDCRGLILAWPSLEIMNISFSRFFNYGEDPLSNEFDVTSAVAFEKIDGSLLMVYFDGNKWCVSTRSMAFAEGQTRFDELTFKDVFEKALGGSVDEVFNGMPEHLCFAFEMTSPYTRVVKRYELGIYPLMIKDKNTLNEDWSIDSLKALTENDCFINARMNLPKVYKFDTFDHVIESMKELDLLDEGYVCVLGDGKPWRIKIKSPSYLAVAHMRNNGELSTKRVVSLVFSNDCEEYFIHFNEDRPLFQPYIDGYEKMLAEVDHLWNEYKNIENQKDFALKVKEYNCSGILFSLRKGKSLTEVLDNMTDNYKEELVKRYITKKVI
jgi:hypothetical protein